MGDIKENMDRVAHFTSSQMSRLTTFGTDKVTPGAPFFTYVQEKIYEKGLLRSLDVGGHSQATAWGNLIEKYVYEHKLGTEYQYSAQTTGVHPTIKTWAGSKDVWVEGVKISDIKAYYPKNFCAMIDSFKDVELFKKNFAKEYWQLASNAAIDGVALAESILFMPYRSELESIREYAANYDGNDQWKYRFIFESEDYDLPYVSDESKVYKDLNIISFEVPQADTDFLTKRVLLASKCMELGITNSKDFKRLKL